MTGAAHDDGPSLRALVVVLLAGLAVFAGILVGAAWMSVATHPPATADVPTAAPIGASSESGYTVWDHNDDGAPIRWDPCSTIEVVWSPQDAPPSAEDDLRRALRVMSAATGIPMELVGATTERPSGDREPYQPRRYGERWAPVLVAWGGPGDDGLPLSDADRGVAIPVAVGPEGDRTYITGQIVLSDDHDDLVGGFAARETSWGATLLHETGHLLGLGHVDDPEELMYVHPGRGPVELGPGDRRGLEALGADRGCRRVPTPQPVDVPPPS